VINVLVAAAIEARTIESVCDDLAIEVSSNTIRGYLKKHLDVLDMREQEVQMNRSLSECLPTELPRESCEMAIDCHDEPFYGKTAELRSYACRSEAKEGTTHFYRLASLYVMWRQVRVTLAVTYVFPEDSTEGVVQRLLERMRHLGWRPRVLYMDKGFCTGAVIAYLQLQHIPALIACPIRGKKGGIRRLCQGKRSVLTDYTFTDGTPVRLALLPTRVPDKTGKRHLKWIAYVLIHLDWSPAKSYQRYRRRFGIESSYRQLAQVRARTTSTHPALRFLLLGLGLLLLNCWVYLRFATTRVLERGPARWFPRLFQLPRFIAFLRRAIERTFGTRDEIPIYAF
jgi:putative transposase